MDKTEKVLVFLFLLTGALFRVYNFWDFSLSNDELSALARLNFHSFSDLLHEGIKIDGHPPAAQVILWYATQWFGNGVFAVRLPFVVAGIAALWFIYKAARIWIGKEGAILTIATYSTLVFPLLYSRIARPYALGMLFVAMASYFWIKIVKRQESKTDYLFLALSLVLAAYSHYFAALVGAIISIVGFLLINKTQYRSYVLSLILGAALFAPYIPIFLYQLNTGGVGQWLGAPENTWLFKHINYAFNESLFIQFLILGTSLAGFILYKSTKSLQNAVVPLLLFLLPFVIGFIYSRNVNPVLQNSTLLFSFPYLLIFLFSGWKGANIKKAIPTSVILFLLICGNTTISNAFFKTNYFGVFKELGSHISDWNVSSEKEVTLIGDFNAPFYIDYYLDNELQLDLYRTSNDSGLYKLKKTLQNSTDSYLAYTWSTRNQIAEVQPIIQQFFPIEVERFTYFNSEAVLYKRGNQAKPNSIFVFEKTENWNFNISKVLTDSTGQKRIIIDKESPYGPTFQIPIEKYETVTVKVELSTYTDEEELQIVFEQENDEGNYAWESDKIAPQLVDNINNWAVGYYEPKYKDKPGKLKVYVWSPSGTSCEIRGMQVWLR